MDVNNDENPELVFKIHNSPDKLMYILGVQNNELVCYDVFETHTSHLFFYLYDNGIACEGQDYGTESVLYETVFYTYTNAGKAKELIHFIKESTSPDDGLYYDYYYLDGDESAKQGLQSDEEYKELIALYRGEEPKWFDCETFADTPE